MMQKYDNNSILPNIRGIFFVIILSRAIIYLVVSNVFLIFAPKKTLKP